MLVCLQFLLLCSTTTTITVHIYSIHLSTKLLTAIAEVRVLIFVIVRPIMEQPVESQGLFQSLLFDLPFSHRIYLFLHPVIFFPPFSCQNIHIFARKRNQHGFCLARVFLALKFCKYFQNWTMDPNDSPSLIVLYCRNVDSLKIDQYSNICLMLSFIHVFFCLFCCCLIILHLYKIKCQSKIK